jgi:hypothetical protein
LHFDRVHLKLGCERGSVSASTTEDEQRISGIEQQREPHGGRASLRLLLIILVFGAAWRARASREASQPAKAASCGGSQAMAVSTSALGALTLIDD